MHLARSTVETAEGIRSFGQCFEEEGGIALAGEPEVAICVLPGTELAFDTDVEYRPQFLSFRSKKLTERVARFRNINPDNPHAYHDALEFPGGRIVLLTDLVEGQRATVLQLPVTERAAEHKTETETPVVPEYIP